MPMPINSVLPFRAPAPDYSRCRATMADAVPRSTAARWAGGYTSSGVPRSAYSNPISNYARTGRTGVR